MKPINYRKILPVLGLGLLATGCFDDNYDLSDIDTTVGVSVNDLVIPIKVDKVTLGSVLDLDDDSKIKEINGEYAFVEEGNFSSSAIKINGVTLSAPYIAPTVQDLTFGPVEISPSLIPDGFSVSLDIAGQQTSFNTEAWNVSPDIVSFKKLGVRLDFEIALSLPLSGLLKTTRVENLAIKLPAGLILEGEGIENYDINTGVYNFGTVEQQGCGLSLQVHVIGIDYAKANVTYEAASSHITFGDELSVKSGELVVNKADINTSSSIKVPAKTTLTINYKMSDITVKTFSGEVKYTINGINISDVEINDLPDILTGENTDLRIANPQIYFSVTNPLNNYKLYAETGFEIKSYAENATSPIGTYSLNAPGTFRIQGVPGRLDYEYYLSPSEVNKFYPGYTNPEHVGYSALSNVLSGKGLPARLAIDLKGCEVPVQPVEDLPLGEAFGEIKGNYTFYAPLGFASGARIVYSDTEDGWWSEDLEALTIKKLTVSANVTNNLPEGINIVFTGYPIDRAGKRINNVSIEGATIKGGTADQKLEIYITGEIRDLDGITFEASVQTGQNTTALTPAMSLELTNIRPCVSGYYEKEL